MKTKLIFALTLPVFLLSPFAQAQDNNISKEMANAIEKAVNEKIETIKADLIKEISAQSQNYCIAEIQDYHPETQTVSVFTKERLVKGKIVNEAHVCVSIPVFIPAGSNVKIDRGDLCVIFFSSINRDGNYEFITNRGGKDASGAFAIAGFFTKEAQERKAYEQARIAALAARLGTINSGIVQMSSNTQTAGGVDTARLCRLVIELNSEMIFHFQQNDFSSLALSLRRIQDELVALQK
ncbi:hypothetical protein [Ereboglobus luteus]|uniref:Uncharacterized protein n=1 Tax=Ereboglobus luteus TaxID=1796921 RepID=A0A2U8E5V5_9BACT|nr:hypothetical protein [Ereboglobus luteus]AWI10318.1 hypothetical protein CKA38_14590 [Ereboglobus luteus]